MVKSDRHKILKTNTKNWETVELSNIAFTEENVNLDGFVGLEVMNDYGGTIVSSDGREKKIIKRKKSESNDSPESSSSEEDLDNFVIKEFKKTGTEKRVKKVKKPKVTNVPGKYVLKNPNSIETESEDDAGESNEENETRKLEIWQNMGLHKNILEALIKNKFYSPTDIQALTIPPAVLGKRDIIGAAETGSGKTLAFAIPIINGIIELKKQLNAEPIVKPQKKKKKVQVEQNPLYALILTPTRELAVQIRDHIKAIGDFCDVKVCAIFGGLSLLKQQRVLSKNPEIIVATPGRLWELLEDGNPHLSKIDKISYLVIDETDRMVEKGHFQELQLLVQRLNDSPMKSKRQNFIFSATLTLVHDLPDYLQKHNEKNKGRFLKQTPGEKIQSLVETLGLNDPKVFDVTQVSGTAKTLTECRITCENDQKDYYLYYLLQKHPGRTIVFCNSIECVRRLAQLFSILECNPLPLHAHMPQRQRLKNLDRFRDNPNAVMIATDVAARGLDIPNVQHVIHYQVPRTSENYVHRSGRTARANKEGIAIMLLDQTEVRFYLKIFSTLGRSDDLPIFPVDPRHLQSMKARVNLAREIDKISLKSRRVFNEINWKNKLAEEAELIIEEDEDQSEDDQAEQVKGIDQDKRLLKIKKAQLTQMLAIPIFNITDYKLKNQQYDGQLASLQPPTEEKSAISKMKTAIHDFNADKKNVRNGKIMQKERYKKLEK